jgi:hypothetical protein
MNGVINHAGIGGFSYRAIPFSVVNIQLPSDNISLATIKFLASIIETFNSERLKKYKTIEAIIKYMTSLF